MQHRYDSLLEAVTSTAVGFIVAMFTYIFIVNPLFDLQSSAAESFWITCIFTVASVLRQYIIRRLFNGKSIYAYFSSRSWLRRSSKYRGLRPASGGDSENQHRFEW